MPSRPYKPNTAYGRRKRREEAQQHFDNLTPEEQQNWNGCLWLILGSIVVGVLILYFMTGNKAFLKWLSH